MIISWTIVHNATLQSFCFNQHSLGLTITRIYVPSAIHSVSSMPVLSSNGVQNNTTEKHLSFLWRITTEQADGALAAFELTIIKKTPLLSLIMMST